MNFVCMMLEFADIFDSLWRFLQWPENARNSLADYFRYVLDIFGLDYYYSATIFVNLIMLSYWKQIKNWEKQPDWLKGIIVSSGFGAVVLNLMSLLRIFSIGGF